MAAARSTYKLFTVYDGSTLSIKIPLSDDWDFDSTIPDAKAITKLEIDFEYLFLFGVNTNARRALLTAMKHVDKIEELIIIHPYEIYIPGFMRTGPERRVSELGGLLNFLNHIE